MVKVKWLKSHAAFSYFKGDSCEVAAKLMADYNLLESGYVIIVPTNDDEGPENTLPPGMPLRDHLFENGFKTVADIEKVGPEGLQELQGVGKASVHKVITWLTDNNLLTPSEE